MSTPKLCERPGNQCKAKAVVRLIAICQCCEEMRSYYVCEKDEQLLREAARNHGLTVETQALA